MKLTRLHRVLQLITVLQNGLAVSSRQLAEEMGISRRTLYRDLKLVRQAGIPILYRRDEGYRLAPWCFQRPTDLDPDEKQAIDLLLTKVAKSASRPVRDPVRTAAQKLLCAMNSPEERTRCRPRRMPSRINW